MQAKVLVVGTGGLGSPALMHLAGSGVGTIGIVEDDLVEDSNLHRQILFNEKDVGKPKLDCALKKLHQINSNIHFVPFTTKLMSHNSLEIMRNFDIVIDGSDNIETKLLINDCAVKLQIPMIYGSVYGFEGHISIFSSPKYPCYRCLYPAPTTKIPNCNENGVVGAIPGIIGTMQALECLKLIICGNNTTLSPVLGKLLIVDGYTLDIKKYTLEKKINCRICSLKQSEINIEGLSHIPEIHSITKYELDKLNDVTIIDVRDPEMWQKSHIPNSINIPLRRLLNEETILQKFKNVSDSIVIYCQYGINSKNCIVALQKKGLSNILNLSGGFQQYLN